MDPKLLSLTLDLQRRAQSMMRADNLDMRLAALDMFDYLDYLGAKIDAGRGHAPDNTTQPEDT